VLIRKAFPGHHHGIGLFRNWPEAIAALDTSTSIASVRAAFAAAGFRYAALEPVRHPARPVIDTLHLLVLRADGASARPPAKPVSGHGAE
jgi:hypothetical protein